MSVVLNQNDIEYYIKPSGTNDFASKKIGIPARSINLDEFLKLSFGETNNEKICLFIKRSNDSVANVFYPANERQKIKNYVDMTRGTNQYISGSTYFKSRKLSKTEVLRTQSNIVRTYILFQDLDFYKLGLTQAEVLEGLVDMIKAGELICPSYVIFTGRGLQLCYRVVPFKNIENYANDRDFRLIQEYLYEKLKKYASDPVSKSPSSVLRLTDSWHYKARKDVRTYFTNEAILTLKDMIFFYGLVPTPDRKVNPKKIIHQTKVKTSNGKVVWNTKNWSEFTLNRQREEDIFIFVKEKNRRKEAYRAKRNWLALILRFHALVSSTGDHKYAENRVLELCNEMDMTNTSVKEIVRRSEPAERFYEEWLNGTWNKKKYMRGGLFYTNKRLLEILEIEEDYRLQWLMKTIKIRNNKYEAARKRFERLEKGEVKSSKEEYSNKRKSDKQAKIEEIRKLLTVNPNMKQKEIAEKLGVKQGTVSKYLKEI